jgi:hypothetical protein
VLLQGGTAIARPEEVFEIQRSLPHGHVAAVCLGLRFNRLRQETPGALPQNRRQWSSTASG